MAPPTAALRTLALAAIASIGAASHARPAPDYVPLRIVTYNVLHGVGAAATSELLNTGSFLTTQDVDGAGPNMGLSPDVVCLQENNVGAAGVAELSNFVSTYLPGYQVRVYNGDSFIFNAIAVRPDITIVSSTNIATLGPRDIGKIKLTVPGALKPLIVYCAHFKAGSTQSDKDMRASESTTAASNVSFEVNFGGGVNVVFAGDLNSNNNGDGSITNLFYTQLAPPVSSGILNLPVESLVNAPNPGVTSYVTFPGSQSRYDYICLDAQLAAFFDADMNGSYSNAELNSMGFVYYSQDDAGLRSNGDTDATSIVSDHRPVVFDIRLPRDPLAPWFEPTDVSKDGFTNIEDLAQWENKFALTAPPAPSPAPDVNGNRNVDLNDRDVIKNGLRAGELADITTP